jgi:hypothetical protein
VGLADAAAVIERPAERVLPQFPDPVRMRCPGIVDPCTATIRGHHAGIDFMLAHRFLSDLGLICASFRAQTHCALRQDRFSDQLARAKQAARFARTRQFGCPAL